MDAEEQDRELRQERTSEEERAQENENDGRLVLLHGFSREEVLTIMRAVRSAASDPADVAFCMSTPVNLEWQLKDLLLEVLKEHAYLKRNPPKLT